MTWNGSKYSAVLTDSNNVLGNYSFSSSASGVNFSVSGNKLTVSSDNPLSGTISITAKKTATRKGVVVWGDGVSSKSTSGHLQDLVTYDEGRHGFRH